jgi:glycosyltransferase involved in cell wall biosynthesis
VVGITHDLSYPHVYTELILAHCGGLGENDAIICCSVAAAQAVQRQVSAVRTLLRPRHASVQLPVIPYGIDAKSVVRFPRFLARTKLGLSPKDFVFLYVGRICGLTKADLTSLVRSFGSIFGGRIDVKLVLAGSTSSKTGQDWYESKLRDLIAKLTLHGQVRLVINPDDEVKTMLYGSADVFVTPACSLQESFGIAVLEAMACGLPVIASDWDGYRDIIVHGETGYLFKTRISDDAISPPSSAFESWPTLLEKIQQAVSLDFGECEEFMLSCEQDRKRTKALGRAGQRRVAQMFDWKIVLRQYQECWSNLIDFAEHKQVETSGVALFPNLPEFFKGHASW